MLHFFPDDQKCLGQFTQTSINSFFDLDRGRSSTRFTRNYFFAAELKNETLMNYGGSTTQDRTNRTNRSAEIKLFHRLPVKMIITRSGDQSLSDKDSLPSEKLLLVIYKSRLNYKYKKKPTLLFID